MSFTEIIVLKFIRESTAKAIRLMADTVSALPNKASSKNGKRNTVMASVIRAVIKSFKRL
jgi:hypothetical protein